jgi:hypothetical protein
MFPPQLFPWHGLLSLGTLRVPPGPPGNHLVNSPASTSSTPPPGLPCSTPGIPPNSLPVTRFKPSAELRSPDVSRSARLPQLQNIFYTLYDAVDDSDDSLDIGGAEGNWLLSLMRAKLSLNKFAKRWGQANYSVFNNWKRVYVARLLKRKHWIIICRQNDLKQLQDGPFDRETPVAYHSVTFQH